MGSQTGSSFNSLRQGPDEHGHFGKYGGMFIAETLVPLILDLQKAYQSIQKDPGFQNELTYYLKNYVGRPSPLWFAKQLTNLANGAKIYLKREDLNHTGAHKINNVMGQILLARRMGKTRIIAETGAGQHGVATATVCALFNMECVIYMGKVDIERQKPNVFRMELLGAKIIPVTAGNATLKDAINEGLRDWVTNVHNSYYLMGTAAGPHPYPMMVRDFQCIIGNEAKKQVLEAEGKLPNKIIAAIGGGSNAIGIFHPFLDDPTVSLIGVEAGGKGLDSGKTAASIERGSSGVLHGNRTYLLQDDDGQITEPYSISAGLDYPGVGPEHSWLHDLKRVEYVPINDDEAVDAFQKCTTKEGIIPALESSHALAHALKIAPAMKSEDIIIVNLSGRGDKDIDNIANYLGVKL
ncbi:MULTISPECIES: tryptophan synthase subunit beta [Commensalibacter]|uniref:tryptophan synthase subunit beta n=1 Tax=Commensalibacter TaxID=1079922 RepID=UPI0018DBD5CA|nr:tryptophan synthase subunit beta [Commensalibacter melissae]MBI0017276.1 tryptophan synthase subunit beta [Commensalibacter sp. B14384M2]MBI0019002.1 tryptophan synthase subunit beta [Commensalibacter sp. W8133]MBI0049428.1 tryptophan synthase subunit beta [Commensalibacter sp. B14384M3]MBI0179486.1 tryptophan synthase subunit beta [Commensalibacter sp. W8163]